MIERAGVAHDAVPKKSIIDRFSVAMTQFEHGA